MSRKGLASNLLVLLSFMALMIAIINHYDTPLHAQAATPGLDRTELFLYEGNAEALKLNSVSGAVQWKSSNKSVAQVSSKGRVTAKKKGSAVITASVGSKKYKCKVTVDRITLNYQEVTIKPKKQLTLSMINSKKKVVSPSKKVKWSSSDKSVATVDSSGTVYAHAAGTTTITGTMSDGTKATCKVQVEGLRFINFPEYINVGDTLKLEYIYIPPLNQKDDLVWTIEYDTLDEEPVVPYSFDQDKNIITALSNAWLYVDVQTKKDYTIADSFAVEIRGSQAGKIEDAKEGYIDQETDRTTEVTKDILNREDTLSEDSLPPYIDYNHLAASNKPTLRADGRFILNQDCSITMFDMPTLFLPEDNWDIWEKFYYTLDGTTPTRNSIRFSSSIYIEQDCTLKMIGASGDITSEVLTINIKLLSNFAKFWGTDPVVDSEACAFAIKNNVSDLSVLNEQELTLYYKTKQILEEIITPGMTDYDKIKAIHDYICTNVSYGVSSNDQDAYGALVLNLCVCNGYADAFKLLTSLCDIPVMDINGDAGGSLPHVWNLVKLEGEWYHIDCNADDIEPENRTQYRFFLVNDAHMPRIFNREYYDVLYRRTYILPAANGEKYNTNTIDHP